MIMILHRVTRNIPTTKAMYGKCLIGYRNQEVKERREREEGKKGGMMKWRRGRRKKDKNHQLKLIR